MSRILGIDVGTNSLGLTVRDESIADNPKDQIVFSSVNLFDSGVGNGKSGEFSFAAERTKTRSLRKIYKVRRYRKWATLRLLIEDAERRYCPISKEELDAWIKYDKTKGLKREYPVNAKLFQQWIRLDFNGDGIPDYSSPYELRNELATVQLDFSEEINRFKLGRAVYHVAQRRGFKSSKGETIQSQEALDSASSELKQSEKETSGKLEEYRTENGCPTIGCALYQINKNGDRIRKEYQAIRKQYKDELKYIFEFQEGLDINSHFYMKLVSEKRSEGTIFYKRPLKSQKGNVGKCPLEPSKSRCPKSRPEVEDFTAWCLINNIRFGVECNEQLTIEEKNILYREVFVRASDFKFENIKKWIEKHRGKKLTYSPDTKLRTINYKDNVAVPACNVTYRFIQLLGEEWNKWNMQTDSLHTNYKDKNCKHKVVYTWEDIWHVCFTSDDEEAIAIFAQKTGLDYELLLKLWNAMPIAYASLSLKAINNINRFLHKGLLYNEACLLAKLPDILKDRWDKQFESLLFDSLSGIIQENSFKRRIANITNSLIAKYKSLPDEEKQGFKDVRYVLTESDVEDVKDAVCTTYGSTTWNNLPKTEQDNIIALVSAQYQSFFADYSRQYVKAERIDDAIRGFLTDNFEQLSPKDLAKIYHHSNIEYYKPACVRKVVRDNGVFSMRLLESPASSSIKNPMALRVLFTLRRKLNDLLEEGIINEDDTRVVVEVARDLNDSNMRWAIRKYQEIHAAENEEYRKILSEYVMPDDLLPKVKMLVEQHNCKDGLEQKASKAKQEFSYERHMNELIKKYRLWVEQGGFCIYTGKSISISNLLNGTMFDIEHTIPRSLSFDDSLSNKTLCSSEYNRNVKGNKLPSQLDDYERILRNIQPWRDRVEEIKGYILFWKNKSKKAQTKPQKDTAIRQVHLWSMEFDYWQKKVNAFLMTDYKPSFRNSQLVDTSIIAKYTMHYLKSVFTRVEVQKGSTTAAFRKILGIQDFGTFKERINNSHHAIDAMVLTLIPTAPIRDEFLRLYYERAETKDRGENTSEIDNNIKKLLRRVGLDFDFTSTIEDIKHTVLAFHETRNKSLTSAKRRKRVRGKIVPVRDSEGRIVFEKDSDENIRKDIYGHPIPLAKEWINGDSIRGELHDKTYYGAIIPSGEKDVRYVIRRELSYKSGQVGEFKDWKDLQDAIVNKNIVEMMKSQFPEGTSFKDACEQGIYAVDRNGKRKYRIRRVRCFASVKNPIKVRRQTYESSKDYKNFFYARNGENVAYCLYSNGKKRVFECLSLFDAAKISHTEDIRDVRDTFLETKKVKGCVYKKLFSIIPGQMVILRQPDESLQDLTKEEISCRLYRIRRIYSPDDGRLQLQHHLETRDDKQLEAAFPNNGKSGKNGFTTINYQAPYPRLLLSLSNQNFWIEGKDFVIKNGAVRILNP